MQSSIRGRLVCPVCSSPLALQVFREEGEEIMEGAFRCPCGVVYPIIGGVPRMLPPHLLAELERDYPAFFELYGDQISVAGFARRPETQVLRQTQEAFGYEWTWAADYHAANFADWLPEGLTAEDLFPGRVGLEVGCGAGRHAAATARLAKEHFAVDLSRAVDAAFPRTRALPNCHVIQADAFHLPFAKATFDYVYCLGVLQHLPNPETGFHALAGQTRLGGLLLVNVYQASRPIMLFLLEAVRQVTIRLPMWLVKDVSVAAGCVDYGLFIGPWRRVRSTAIGRLLRRFVPTRIDEYAKYDFHTCVTDWFDRLSCPVKKHYRRDHLLRWYEEAGYSNVTVTPYWKAFWNGCGTRTESLAPTAL
jgi:SAM-dependent methyltransferase/uncharacterized protein YbaR (Trm112 family)